MVTDNSEVCPAAFPFHSTAAHEFTWIGMIKSGTLVLLSAKVLLPMLHTSIRLADIGRESLEHPSGMLTRIQVRWSGNFWPVAGNSQSRVWIGEDAQRVRESSRMGGARTESRQVHPEPDRCLEILQSVGQCPH
ncbi:MAG: hypothetical protein JWO04_3716 [Gammaproteobacteria bacterium]|nr:hypothetical protein [Gammaproteobacteria bacterium]